MFEWLRSASAMSALVLTAAVALPATAAPVENPVPAEVFAATPGLQGAKLSPDGRRIAAKIDLKGEQALVITSLGKSEPPHIMSAGDLDIDSWRWVNNDWLVLGVGNTEYISGIDIYVTRLISVSADLSVFHKIDWEHSGQFADDVIWIAPDGSPRILLSKETGLFNDEDVVPSVYQVDVSTGKSKLVLGSVANVVKWYAGPDGTVRMGFTGASRNAGSAYYYREPGSKFSMTPTKDSKGHEVPQPVIFMPGGKSVGFAQVGGFDAVAELQGFAPSRSLFSAPGYDVDSIRTTPDRSAVLGVDYVANNERTEWFDPTLKAVQQELDERAGPGNASIVSWSQDKSKLLVAMGDASQAGGVYLWDRAVGIPSFLGWNNPALKDRHLNPVKTIQYKARDGTPIQAVVTLPRGQEARNLPLIVMPHGGPGARDSESFDWWVQYLAEQGYAVIQPNYRGSTGFGSSFYRLGEGQMGRKMQDDLLDAISWASDSGIADAKRVCIIGGSYGGYAAMRAAQRDGTHYRCAVSYAGVSDLNEMMKYDRAFLLGSDPKRYWKTLAPDFMEVSPRNHPSEFSIPILVMHGAKDKRVPVKQSRALITALNKAGKAVTYIEQPLGDHHFTRGEDRLQFLKAMKVFLDKYNPAA